MDRSVSELGEVPPIPPTKPIFCLPHAGGSGAVVASWLARESPQLSPVGLEYPGHGRRMSEPFAESVADLVADLEPRLAGQTDLRLYGHSLGAVVAFELALALRAAGEARIAGVVVSGCTPPDSWAPQSVEISDEALLSFLFAGGGGAELFEAEELRELFLPLLRADIEMAARYGPDFDCPSDFPVLALCGARDPIAPQEAMEGWGDLTRKFAGVVVLEGDHFFPRDRPREVCDAMDQFFSNVSKAQGADA